MSEYLKALGCRFGDWLGDDGAQGLTEYALILALIALVAIIALTLVGGDVSTQIDAAGSSIPS